MGQVLTGRPAEGLRPTTGEGLQPGAELDGTADVGPTHGSTATGHGRTVLCRMKGVGKHFSGAWACRGVDLTILAGEVHAVLGENGAGKSTLMKLLHGVHAPDEGSIEIDGRAVTFSSPRDAEDAGVAMIPQELDLFPDLSVCENLYVGRQRPRTRFGAFDWAAMRREARAVFSEARPRH